MTASEGAAGGGDTQRPANALVRTPDLPLGPYYPLRVKMRGRSSVRDRVDAGRAPGGLLELKGRVADVHGKALTHVRIEIWHTDAHGRYAHPNDASSALVDPGFIGWQETTTDEHGCYRFRFEKPGTYVVGLDRHRAPHVHFQVTGRVDRLVTQMFFPGEPLNEPDSILHAVRRRDAVIAALDGHGSHGVAMARWDIVLQQG